MKSSDARIANWNKFRRRFLELWTLLSAANPARLYHQRIQSCLKNEKSTCQIRNVVKSSDGTQKWQTGKNFGDVFLGTWPNNRSTYYALRTKRVPVKLISNRGSNRQKGFFDHKRQSNCRMKPRKKNFGESPRATAW